MSERIGKGSLLIASASLLDPTFQYSVVLICEHGQSGTYGLVLNQPLEASDETLQRMPFLADRLYCGGPVRKSSLQILHPYGHSIADATTVLEHVWVGGNFHELEDGIQAGQFDPKACRFFLGYAGWDPGQLVAEIREGSWLCTLATPDLVFHCSPRKLWAWAVRECGRHQHPLLANFPEDPSYN